MLIHSLVCLDRAGAAGGAAISVWALLCHSVWTGSCMATRGHTRVKSMRMGMGIILAHVHACMSCAVEPGFACSELERDLSTSCMAMPWRH